MAKGSRTKFYNDMRAYHHGVTGSCIRNTFHFSDGLKTRILIDKGISQGKDSQYNIENKNCTKLLDYYDGVNPEKITATIITHPHADHDGAIAAFVNQGYTGKFFMCTPCSIILPTSLNDIYNVMKKTAKTKKLPVLYDEQTNSKVLNQVRACKFEVPVPITDRITVTFFNNGHLVGASIVLLQVIDPSGEEINLLFTGDYKSSNLFLDLKPLPEWVYKLQNLTIICESTYGTTNSEDVKEVWANNMEEACYKKSIIVIPTFAQGRMQEMMYHLKELQDNGIVPKDYVIEVAGNSGIEYTKTYINNSRDLQIKDEMIHSDEDYKQIAFYPKNIHFVDSSLHTSVRIDNKTPRIILTTSGMGNFGPANSYIPEVLPNPNAVIHFTGYLAENTLGRKLQEAEYGESVNIKGMIIAKRSCIFSTSEFSSHAKADELINFLNKFCSRAILLNHGEPDVKTEFAKRVAKETTTRKVGVLGNGYVYRIDPYGIVKAVEK